LLPEFTLSLAEGVEITTQHFARDIPSFGAALPGWVLLVALI